jgi:hypothetical protein
LKDTHFINTFEFHSFASKACISLIKKEEGNILIIGFSQRSSSRKHRDFKNSFPLKLSKVLNLCEKFNQYKHDKSRKKFPPKFDKILGFYRFTSAFIRYYF